VAWIQIDHHKAKKMKCRRWWKARDASLSFPINAFEFAWLSSGSHFESSFDPSNCHDYQK
jgi:hypothetical protein